MPRRSKTEELLDFEIAFYEKLLRAYPGFVDVLIPLGEAFTRRGLHERGLEVDLQLTRLRSEDPIMWYNLACSYSLLRRLEESSQALRRSIELGYTDFNHLRKDPDLLNLRQSPTFRHLFDSVAPQAPRPGSSSPGTPPA